MANKSFVPTRLKKLLKLAEYAKKYCNENSLLHVNACDYAELIDYLTKERPKTIYEKCKNCNVSLKGAHANTKYCPSCREKMKKVWSKEAYEARRTTTDKPRVCLDCGDDLSNRHTNAKRCFDCNAIVEKKRREKRKQKRKFKTTLFETD